ncbi:MAG: PQQ-dependent sugar dehydrogenase, partial [Nitrospirota bacterium]|nr:PQQ-dependent sugar dehydrogenase [Nitrospirota bacterium]
MLFHPLQPGQNHQYLRSLLTCLSLLGSLILVPPSSFALSGKPVVSSGPIALQPLVAHRFAQPIFLAPSPDQSDRLFVLEQHGRILIVKGNAVLPRPFLDIGEKLSTGGERGLLGLAFHPRFSSNGRLFVNYTRAEDRAT